MSLKLYLDVPATAAWNAAVAAIVRRSPAVADGRVRMFVLPSLPMVADTVSAFAGTPVEVGAQDLFWEDRGPFTGGVSGPDLAAIGCRLVEVGHAERRRVFGEDEGVVVRKLAAAFRAGLTPVLCVGEEQWGPAEDAAASCLERLDARLAAAGGTGPLIVAYEPEWAIGSDAAAGPDHVRRVTRTLRERLADDPTRAGSAVLYGGSAGPGTLPDLHPDVDGLFLGRFAHDPNAVEHILGEAAAL